MKPKLEQEIWYIGYFTGGKYLEKMKVGYIGKECFICQENLKMTIAFASYGSSWFLTKEEALEWLDKHDYERNDNIFADMKGRIFTKKGE